MWAEPSSMSRLPAPRTERQRSGHAEDQVAALRFGTPPPRRVTKFRTKSPEGSDPAQPCPAPAARTGGRAPPPPPAARSDCRQVSQRQTPPRGSRQPDRDGPGSRAAQAALARPPRPSARAGGWQPARKGPLRRRVGGGGGDGAAAPRPGAAFRCIPRRGRAAARGPPSHSRPSLRRERSGRCRRGGGGAPRRPPQPRPPPAPLPAGQDGPVPRGGRGEARRGGAGAGQAAGGSRPGPSAPLTWLSSFSAAMRSLGSMVPFRAWMILLGSIFPFPRRRAALPRGQEEEEEEEPPPPLAPPPPPPPPPCHNPRLVSPTPPGPSPEPFTGLRQRGIGKRAPLYGRSAAFWLGAELGERWPPSCCTDNSRRGWLAAGGVREPFPRPWLPGGGGHVAVRNGTPATVGRRAPLPEGEERPGGGRPLSWGSVCGCSSAASASRAACPAPHPCGQRQETRLVASRRCRGDGGEAGPCGTGPWRAAGPGSRGGEGAARARPGEAGARRCCVELPPSIPACWPLPTLHWATRLARAHRSRRHLVARPTGCFQTLRARRLCQHVLSPHLKTLLVFFLNSLLLFPVVFQRAQQAPLFCICCHASCLREN